MKSVLTCATRCWRGPRRMRRSSATGSGTDRWQFDLAGYCAARLRAAGVGHVIVTGVDTLADEDRFFSHRRRTLAKSGPIGHQISVIRAA